MFVIDCPWCGARPQSEFSAHGEAHIRRPPEPEAASDAEWATYLFERQNPKGPVLERWRHGHGCRRWFNIARDTATDAIFASYPANAPPPVAMRPALTTGPPPLLSPCARRPGRSSGPTRWRSTAPDTTEADAAMNAVENTSQGGIESLAAGFNFLNLAFYGLGLVIAMRVYRDREYWDAKDKADELSEKIAAKQAQMKGMRRGM